MPNDYYDLICTTPDGLMAERLRRLTRRGQ
jgi:hypothetical protein